MKLKDLIPLGILGAGLLFLTGKKAPAGAEMPPAAYGGVEKTREVSVSDNTGTTFKVEVPKDSTIKQTTALGGAKQTEVYREDGTLQAIYTAPTKTWKDIEKEQQEIIKTSGSPIKETITYKTSEGTTKTGGFITTIDLKTGKTKMLTEGSYKVLKEQGKVL
jgi:hypothetical protein